jgi:hypothetical protein
MTLPQAFELFDYWRQSPPTHELMAAHVGYEPPKTTEQQIAAGAQSGDAALAAAMAARMAQMQQTT